MLKTVPRYLVTVIHQVKQLLSRKIVMNKKKQEKRRTYTKRKK